MFDKYRDLEKSEAVISEAGLEKFFQDLGVDAANDVVTLALAWRAGAKALGEFSKEEFTTLFQSFRVDTITKLRDKLPGALYEPSESCALSPSPSPRLPSPDPRCRLARRLEDAGRL